MSKAQRKPTKITVAGRPQRRPTHLNKEELQRVEGLKGKILAVRGDSRPDVQSTLQLIYLRVLERVEERGQVSKELKELESLLDQAATLTTQILDKAEKPARAK